MTAHPDQAMRDRLAAYAIGAMEPDERAAFEQELEAHFAEGCPECERLLFEFREAAVSLARSAPAAKPSELLRSRVLDAVKLDIESDRQHRQPEIESPRERAAGRRWPMALGWAAALVVAIMGAIGWERYFSARDLLDESRRELAVLDATLIEMERQLGESRSLQTTMVAANVEIIPLAPTSQDEPAPGARIAYDPATGTAIALFRDATPPPGRDYQLWALQDEGVKNLGVLTADAAGLLQLQLELRDIAGVLKGFAVSLEPQGGSPDPSAPSGPVVSVGLRVDRS